MTARAQLPMAFDAQPKVAVPPLWLGICITHRQLFDALQDEWLTPPAGASGHLLGVHRFATANELAQPGNLVITYLQLDPQRLPQAQVQIRRRGQWDFAPLNELEVTDEAIFWPGVLPTFAITAVLVGKAEEAARLTGMAAQVSNVALPSGVALLQGDEPLWRGDGPQGADQLVPPLVVPGGVDAVRGATAMAVRAVPRIAPWLNLLAASLAPPTPQLLQLAAQVDAPFWAYPPWYELISVDKRAALPLQTRLWLAAVEVLRSTDAKAGQSAAELVRAIAERTTSHESGSDAVELVAWTNETLSILRGDAAIRPGGSQASVGTALQMVLTRPLPALFWTWLDDLPMLSPAVWWSAAVLCGLLNGYRRLELKFRGKESAQRQCLASHALWASNQSALDPSGLATQHTAPTWRIEAGQVVFAWDAFQFTIGQEQARGRWYEANLADPIVRQAAIKISKQLHWPCVYLELVLADVDLPISGPGQVLATDIPARHLIVKGSAHIRLPLSPNIKEDLADDDFRHWVATAVCAQLPPPPVTTPSPSSPALPGSASVLPSQTLLDSLPAPQPNQSVGAQSEVPGLIYRPDFLTEAEETKLLTAIDNEPWLDELARRVQHYGFKYDYKARNVDAAMRLGPLPSWAAQLSDRLHAMGLLPHLANQVIVNEYVGTQGISKHTDCKHCFADGIATISLGESWEMVFTEQAASEHKVTLLLQRRSVAVLTGASRYLWTHEIPKRKKTPAGALRGRRVSITFRQVQVSDAVKPSRIRRSPKPPTSNKELR